MYNLENSKSDQENLFASHQYQEQLGEQSPKQVQWSFRYKSHFLIAQSVNMADSIEQREAAQSQAKLMKYQFKFALVIYLARFPSPAGNKQPKNPTRLKDEVLRLIKKIFAKQQTCNYLESANLFRQQTRQKKYKQFKQSLLKYLIKHVDNKEVIDTLKLNLSRKLGYLYEDVREENLSNELIVKTCQQLIHYLTIEEYGEPSTIFVLLVYQGHPLTLVILLLKIIFICKNAYNHLETCIANLIRYYEEYPEAECIQVINFLEIFDVIFTMHANDVSVEG